MINYWEGDANDAETLRGRLEGLATSILSAIDGYSNTPLPSYALIPIPHPDDKLRDISHNLNYYPRAQIQDGQCDIAGELRHGLYGVVINDIDSYLKKGDKINE